MAHTTFLIWASCLLLIFITAHHVEGIGICWGRLTSHKLLPSAVVDMLLADGIPKVKLFSYNYGVLAAFSKSNISITLSLAHKEIFQINTTIGAQKWVNENITSMIRDQVKITHVLIGHEPYTIVNNETYYLEDIFPSLQNVQTALNAANLGDIKASVAYFTDILKPNITKPSDGDFRDDIKEEILKILHYIDSQNSPFMFNMYPMFNLYEKGYPLEFGFFEESKNFSIVDGDNVYTNVFDVTYDTIVSALRKNGFPHMQIIVSQVGWPTDGNKYANLQNAKRFYDGFFKKLANNKGTPLQQGPLEVYVYSLVDENNRTMQVRGPAERHYGIYNYSGQAKFDLDFTLQGRNKKLEPAQGTAFMPQRWCVFDPNVTADVGQHQKYIDLACKRADCSCLAYGSSCHGLLDFEGNLSYAFNMFFQMNNQRVNDDACSFDGLGKIVVKDPSRGNCTFPLQILSTLFIGGYGEMVATLPKSGETFHLPSGTMIILPLLSMFFITLF